MLRRAVFFSFFCLSIVSAYGKVVIFWQAGFPTLESQPIARQTVEQAFAGAEPVFAGIAEFRRPDLLARTDLLVLPYGSAFPADVWKPIHDYLDGGGNLLTLGGRPLFVPVTGDQGSFVVGRPQNTYSRHLGIAHTYEVPQKEWTTFVWAYPDVFPGKIELRAKKVFVGALDGNSGSHRGLGFLLNSAGERVAAPITREDFISQNTGDLRGARLVFLNFDPEPGFWESPAGVDLIRQCASHARQGATYLHLEMQHATIGEAEVPHVVVHLRNVSRQRREMPQTGIVRLELRRGAEVLASAKVDYSGSETTKDIGFGNLRLSPGLYFIKGSYQEGSATREVHQTGFWVRDARLLKSGPPLSTDATCFRKGGAPFLPFGTNYFSTDDFRGSFVGGNAYVWDRDFAEMEKDGITFVRTGVWNNHADILDRLTGGASERFLRGVEAYVLSAVRHNIHVNFTFYAFDPQTVRRFPGEEPLQFGPGANPYTDPLAIQAQLNYIQSVVNRFRDVPSMSWDLINEPSFSNPRRLWKGNTPNGDLTEMAAWNQWLEKHYGNTGDLSRAWNTTPEELGPFGTIPLPSPDSLEASRSGNSEQVRAVDYNLFAQEMFKRWAATMIAGIRSTGSTQLVNVGHDEGGVADRVLNQFYGDSGVGFTTNHTWWRDDALLWDSVVAKRPGLPNLVGETGVQPVWQMDSSWRWDEPGALGLYERKLALGLAAGNSGSLQWDWAHGDVYGIKRSDGSNKIWYDVLRGMAQFALKAAPAITEPRAPEVAVVLPQSLQLSVYNPYALEGQQRSVRALFQYARSSAYVVGEYQIDLLGNPKLIILPSPWIMNQQAWDAVLAKVRAGAVLLVSGRFDADEHFHATERHKEVGLDYTPGLLTTREVLVDFPSGRALLSYPGEKCTHLERGFLADGRTFAEAKVGQGTVLFVAVPIELNENIKAVGDTYRMALTRAGVAPVYATTLDDPGILIAPTDLGSATLYVLTSESATAQEVSFKDNASGKDIRGRLEPGRAALLLVSKSGQVLATYNWKERAS